MGVREGKKKSHGSETGSTGHCRAAFVNRTPVIRVTGGDTNHYTISDWLPRAAPRTRALVASSLLWRLRPFFLPLTGRKGEMRELG